MRLFRFGYVATVSFLLILATVTLTLGFYPAPTGPKAPTYPTPLPFDYSATNSAQSQQRMQQEETQQQQYDAQQQQYQNDQKSFMQDKVVPYARNVFVFWLVTIGLFELIGILISRFLSNLVGAAFSLSGVWAVFFGPIGGILWYANALVNSFGGKAEQSFSADPILQAVGLTSLIVVVVVAITGAIFYYNRKPDQSL